MNDLARDRFDRRDYRFFAICLIAGAAALYVVMRYFAAAFPEAAIEFRYDRESSRPIAERLVREQQLDPASYHHTAVFDDDDNAKTFLERTLGLERASRLIAHDVHIWYWRHRWFRPGEEEETRADVAPTGELVSYSRIIPESRAIPDGGVAGARHIAEEFLKRAGVDPASIDFVAQSERALPKRMQRSFTWESRRIRPGGAPYRYDVRVDGNVVTDYSQHLRVPDEWQRSYRELRSKNEAAGNVDGVLLQFTMAACLIVFVRRLLRGDMQLRFLGGIGIAAVVLVTGTALNSYPSALAGYETTTSYPGFIGKLIFFALVQGLGTAVLLMVIAGAGEALYRESRPRQLAMPRVFRPAGLRSKRVFRSLILGYTMVALFLAYQVAFYLIAQRFGAWSPAEVPYDDMLNSAFPWVAVLFAGFFPALSEEFMSRAFSIPLFERLFRSRTVAIVVAAFIWGFGHATYANQPFYIRGVEVGIAGIFIGILMQRFGLLPLLIWHYTVDAMYTALLLMRSHNLYYASSGAAASLVFAVPLIVSLVLYFRNGGFVPDEELSNAAVGSVPPQPKKARESAPPLLPPPVTIGRTRAIVCIVSVIVAAMLIAAAPKNEEDAADYRVSREAAVAIAIRHLQENHVRIPPMRIAVPVSGFRAWNADSGREDGGSPTGFDSTAARWMRKQGLSTDALATLYRTDVQAATWSVRFFTPRQKDEYFVEVDARLGRVIGYHTLQDEAKGGARLDQPAALAIARVALAKQQIAPGALELKEAQSFQRPNRRDWLFHFQGRAPIVAQAYRRVTIRVAGDEVTQLTSTIKIPDAVYREASVRTLGNTLLTIVQLLGAVCVLGLIVAGFIAVARTAGFPWRQPLLWTSCYAIFPLVRLALEYQSSLFEYNTSLAWSTFLFDLTIDDARSVIFELGGVFLSLVALRSLYPFASALLQREGRRRFGRPAVVGALTALGIFATYRLLVDRLHDLVPSLITVHPVGGSLDVAIAFPAFISIGTAILHAILASAAIAMFSVVLRGLRRPVLTTVIGIGSLFAISVDPSLPMREVPLMLLLSLITAVLSWTIATRVIGSNLLALPLAVFCGELLVDAGSLLRNHRFDLQVNAVVEVAVVAALLLWLAVKSRQSTESAQLSYDTAGAPASGELPPDTRHSHRV
jgi:membrane protease YdiL (CAAX protease family)